MERNFKTIFEITEQPLNFAWLILLIFVIGGILLFLNSAKKSFAKIFSIFYTAISLFFLIYLGIGNIYSLDQLRTHYKKGNYSVAEGYVTDFIPAKPKSAESYKVNNVSFRDGRGSYGYDETYETDGRIHDGAYVRLFYIETNKGKVILRVDIDR